MTQKRTHRKPRRQKKWLPLGLLLAVLVGLGAGGGWHYSKRQLIRDYVTAYQAKGDTFENIKEYLVWDDTDEKVTNDEAQYAVFKKLDKAEALLLSQNLQKATAKDDLYVKRVGRRWKVFPNYRVAMKPMDLTLKTNVKGADLLLNDKKVATSDKDDFSLTLEHLPIATYTASLDGTYKDKPLELTKTYDGSTHTLDLSVTFKTLTVTSNLADGDLYIDKTRIGTLTDGSYELEDYPLGTAAQAYVKKSYPDGDLQTKKKALADVADGKSLALDVDNLLDEDKAGQLVISAFDQLILYMNAGADPDDLESVFEKGADNDFYQGLKDSITARMQTDSRRATSLTIPSIWLNSMDQVGKNSYLLNFSAVYDFYYDKATDSKEQTHGDVIENLTGEMTVTQSGDSYVVAQSGQQSLTVTSQENKVAADAIFPSNLVGTWELKQGDKTTTLTIEANGIVTKKVTSKKEGDSTHIARVTKVEDKGKGTYHYVYDEGTDESTFITGGIGGAGVKYTYGVKVDGDTLQPVVWQTGTKDDFNYDKPLTGETFKRQK